ncbi:hypothetical protein BIV23_31700 [Streptomyces monashensis]|uniref:Uncharacterized protein n=1 Tax=Streptomyces monashensis TaxID=1678012 RepID=A0A1S2PTB6_9ACTN|nr:hypothetical protein [Streptomyces monashensis]OIJ97058.1 hypothetical protein BIV23_31700 [Streptomyces monashensis]
MTYAPGDLRGMREAEIIDGQDLHYAGLLAAVSLGAVGELRGHVLPGQHVQPLVESGLVLLHAQCVVRLLVLYEEAGMAAPGVQGIGRHGHPGQVERGQQAGEAGDFT